MKGYEDEYFYIKICGINYPLLKFENNSDVFYLYKENEAKITNTICLKFSKPIPENPKLGDFHSTGGFDVISDRLKNLLECLNLKNVQFIPVNILDKSNCNHTGYYIVHVYNIISDFSCLDNIPLKERLVFILQEKRDIIYHQSIIEKILELHPKGLCIYRLSKYDESYTFQYEYFDYLNSGGDVSNECTNPIREEYLDEIKTKSISSLNYLKRVEHIAKPSMPIQELLETVNIILGKNSIYDSLRDWEISEDGNIRVRYNRPHNDKSKKKEKRDYYHVHIEHIDSNDRIKILDGYDIKIPVGEKNSLFYNAFVHEVLFKNKLSIDQKTKIFNLIIQAGGLYMKKNTYLNLKFMNIFINELVEILDMFIKKSNI